MAVLNIENSFLTENRSVYSFLNQSGQGLYIPLYQREYSWDSDNIEQLLEDLSRGIYRIASGDVTDDAKEIRFLGTIITVVESNRNNIYPVDPQAVPGRIEKLIDGQQRVSTIALMATLLVKQLRFIQTQPKTASSITDELNEICNLWISKLEKIYSFDLGRGKPTLKPKLARGSVDYWTRERDVDEAYRSELSNYLGHFIQAYVDKTQLPCLSKEKYGNSLLYKNGRRIESWLKKEVSTAHEGNEGDAFASAVDIISHFKQEAIWDYERPHFLELIRENNHTDKRSDSYILCELVQVLSVCHYLLDRCCFTIIQPTDDDWAFDMFQSLNATGTPLTAIETFKPTIVNTIENNDADNSQFKNSLSEKYFKKVEDFLSEATNAQQKNKRTNDFLTSFFVTYDGSTISTHFSYQRKILIKAYTDCTSLSEKELLLRDMGNYADFYKYWLQFGASDNRVFYGLEGLHDADLASMLLLFLKSSNHKMAITILGSMYGHIINGEEHSGDDFVEAVKLIGFYYFLWRSAYSNSGLDTTYREFFKNLKDKKTLCSIDEIRKHIKAILTRKEIATFDQWKAKAQNQLKYDATGNDVIRMALLITAHDTMPDESVVGLIKESRAGSSPYMSMEKWRSVDLKTIEHIAPQSNKNGLWDENLYNQQTSPYNQLGNLTLLPQDLNSSAGNKGWKEKLLYYQCVAERDADKLNEIAKIADGYGVTFNDSTLTLLKDCTYNAHLLPISQMSLSDSWNIELVQKRTDKMLEIIWNRISKVILQ